MANQSRNNRNSESILFRSLTRLLSGPISNYRRQNPRALKRQQLDKFKFKSASGQGFKKSSNNPLAQIYANSRNSQNRAERYIDFDQMEYDPLINAALDVYAAEMTTSSQLQKLLTINCPNEEIKGVLESLYYDILNIEFNLFGWCRDTVKYGDKILYLDIDDKEGLKYVVGLPTMEVERLEGEDKTNPAYVQFQWNSGGMTFENWQIAHFRILGHDKYSPYGASILDGARRIWRQYCLQLDAMMAYRVVRCIHGDSEIKTEYGQKKIKDIKVGDKVFSYDHRADKLYLTVVLDWINNGKQQIWITQSTNRSIKSNFNHPILVRNRATKGIGYVQVCELIPKIHQFILPINNTNNVIYEDITHVFSTSEYSDVYDIRVSSEHHNFIANDLVVHNSPERRVFYIDVGGIADKDVEQYMQKIISEMKKNQIVDAATGQIDLRYNAFSVDEDFFIATNGPNSGTKIESLPGGTYPVRKDSEIPLLDGRKITIEELAKEYELGNENWVYSIQDKTQQIVPGKVVWCGKNYKCYNIHRVWLDDNSYVDMAPEHPVILRDGSSKRADQLKENDSLMPFYFEINNKKEKLKNYPTLLNPSSNKFEFVHRLIANSIGGKEIALDRSGENSCVIHHVDFNKINNIPCNLKWMGFWEHRDFHKHDELSKDKAREILRNYLFSDKHKENTRNRISNPNDKLHKWIYSEKNIQRLVEFNKSSQTIEKTIIRNRERWVDDNFRKLHSGDNHWLRKKWTNFYSKHSLYDVQQFCILKNIFTMKDLISNSESFLKTKEQCRKFLKFHGINSWIDFRMKYLNTLKNHKVLKVEIIPDIDDVYCMTVVGPNNEDDRHNFAVCSKGISNTNGKLNGIFVKNTGDIDDVKFLRDNMLASLKIPHAYLVSTGDSVEDKTTLSQKDIQFARTVQRLQRSIISELEKMGLIHLYILGYRGKDLLSFKLRLNNPSKIAELQELEHWKTKFEVAASATEGFFSNRWVAKNILDLSDEVFLRNIRERYFDTKIASSLEKISSENIDKDELSSELGLDDSELDVDSDASNDDEEEVLLAAPGKRHDEHITPGSKGKKYKPVISDARPSGARKRHMGGLASNEMASSTFRNIYKGGSDLRSLARGIYEEIKTNYEKDDFLSENKVLKDNIEIKSILESLSKRKETDKSILLENKLEEKNEIQT